MIGDFPTQLPDDQIARVPDGRVAASIGRAARLELAFERRGDRTVVAHAYAEPPFRIGRAFDLGGAAYVIVVCSGPGVFSGDTLRQSVHVGGGARVVLTSQAALQIHPPAVAATEGSPAPHPASVRHDYIVEEDAELHCQWDPVIPFAGAQLDQRFDLRLAESARLFWGDAVMAGRISRGEAWRFTSLAHELRLQVGLTLAYLERYTLVPADRAVERRWMCGAAPYVATSLVRHHCASRDLADQLHRDLPPEPGIEAAVDLLEPGLLLARFLGHRGAPFARARASYRASALQAIFGGQELTERK